MGLIAGSGAQGAAGGSLPAGSVDADTLVWDSTTNLWVVRQPLYCLSLGAQGLAALADQFFGPTVTGTVGTTTAITGAWILPFDCLFYRLTTLHANSSLGTANPVTWTLHINAVNTALAITVNTNIGTPQTDNEAGGIAYTAGQTIHIRATWATALAQGIRPSWALAYRPT